MTFGISFKLNCMIVLLTLSAGLLLGGFFIHYQEKKQTEALEKRASAIIDNLAYNGRYPILVGDHDGLAALFDGLISSPEIVYGAALDAQGNILYKTSKDYQGNTRSFSTPVISENLWVDEFGAVEVFDKNDNAERIGSVRLDFSLAGLQEELSQMRLIITAAVTTLVLVLMLSASFGIRKLVVTPLKKLASEMATIGAGQLDHRITLSTRDEMSQLATSFNRMTADLSRTVVSKDFLDNVFQSMNDALIVVDANDCIKTANRAALEMTGYAEELLLGATLDQVLLPDDPQGEPQAEEQDAVRNIQTHFCKSDGSRVPVLFSRSPLIDAAGTHQGAVCVALDITERLRSEQELRESTAQIREQNEEMRKFLFISSHDLQEPLRKIQTFSSRLSREVDNFSDKGRHIFDRLATAVKRMSTQLEDLRAFSEIGAEQTQWEPVDLQQQSRKVCQRLQNEIAECVATVKIGSLPTVLGDAAQINRLLASLVDNALKFRSDERPLEICIESEERSGDLWEIKITDNGIGFEPQYAERIFEVFQQLHSTEKYSGTGMGLAICRKIVRRHGGDLRAEGRPAEGATFYLTLPASPGCENAA